MTTDTKEKKIKANGVLFDHYSEFPASRWRWENFTPRELACRGTGRLMVDFKSLDCLQKLRDTLGKPLVLNSAYRSPEHNFAVRGARQSQHLRARAFDVKMAGHDPEQFEAAARECGFTSFGYYVRQGFMHIDTRKTPAKWGAPFPK